MMHWLSNALDQWQLMHSLELLATLLALAYVILALRQSLWCWPAALLSTILFTHIMWDSALLSDALLQLYYAAMALYGWWRWQQLKQQHKGQNTVSEWPWRRHMQLILITALAGVLLGYVMANFTRADFAYLDAQTTVFSVMATWLVARKLVSNWLYWVVIDAVSIYVYAQKHLYFLTLLFMLYTIIALAGYFIWRANYQQQPQLATSAR
ncbi:MULTISPECIES: nicotinamide riboside transporter PnuC [unclassified Arsukibacterium]|uniref:nicotinamide riboside transporter PnuC n=1 Tax=unclassified Arsukibacterium TaxID=2635278 RepID=UPI000C6989AC|nr:MULTISPECIES: nicotinamide riboside transporter PnuC [unclassified Arsukibacterium]MAA94169.1 nicotinamide mononucleotide transporter [Rheinheimera sp.]MBM34153.1 nicotinamide mononucleotide transporter [Rheinheimera sp.]HAW92469.1 nicotinamide mononucleotide transporter [Candidatus Azambacteria bacterium]|tara:strand:- start:133386 stop:134015 length:630 start_codon:yes stop_codon:yes gene_type:complete